jgi:transposase
LVRGTRIAIEATSCFYPLYDGLRAVNKVEVSVVNTVKLEKPAIKTDRRDALRIAHLLRRNELPVAFIPEPELRLQRELCVLRVRLVASCTQCKNRIHAILHKEGKRPVGVNGVFGKKARAQFAKLCESITRKDEFEEELSLLEIHEKKLARIEERIRNVVANDSSLAKQVALVDSVPGFAEVLSYVVVTELGPIQRFRRAESLVAYAGLHPCIDSSGGKTNYGKMRRVGRKLFRTALVEAAHAAGKTKTPIGEYFRRKARQKKSNHAAAIATANKLARLLYEVLSKQKMYQSKLQ